MREINPTHPLIWICNSIAIQMLLAGINNIKKIWGNSMSKNLYWWLLKVTFLRCWAIPWILIACFLKAGSSKFFVKMSATISSVGLCCTSITPFADSFLTKWNLHSICFDLSDTSSEVANLIVVVLSCHILCTFTWFWSISYRKFLIHSSYR